ncbi:putative elongation factor 2 protein [Erysiphe necator]|uniref:Elongation factor-like 1 n=1 Tax=Uncinula necator TaxID=52586 RepID=A0A0B1PBE3_UNCNE|nr:putative elongation factor 2 protein [Erysiphe necator]
MPVVSSDQLISLQRNPEGIRNICILAHVDHGKTSLTDILIATNGIISPKLAGKIRYLDSRHDEQTRGITMESSAISLYFTMLRKSTPESKPEKKDYLINLVDSPGHIDFSSEVSTASRLCDGAVVLVDAVEGVCSQTVTVLRQTWIENMKPLLVINKMDRLITELKMTPVEAFIHLSKLLEQVNAVLGSFFQGERMEEDLNWRDKMEERITSIAKKERNTNLDSANGNNEDVLHPSNISPADFVFEEKDDTDLYFAPEKNNVIFSSAIDGWAFTVRQFACIYEKKLGIKRSTIERVLWGDYYLDPKTKKILAQKHLKGRNLKPMFAQLVLEQIWAVYHATICSDNGKGNPAVLEKITKSLKITLPTHISRSRDTRAILTAVFGSWLPLSTALLVSVIESLPSPLTAQEIRLPKLMDLSPGANFIDPILRKAMIESRSSTKDPKVAFISKMLSIPESELPENKIRRGILSPEEAREIARRKRIEIAQAQALKSEYNYLDSISELSTSKDCELEGVDTHELNDHLDPERLIGFARIYSGTLSVCDFVYVIPPKFSPEYPHKSPEPKRVKVTALYLLMGRELEPLTSVPAGVLFGIGGLEGHILKSGTICSQLEGSINLAGINMGTQPIVRVALEPINPTNLDKMVNGLKLLVQSDPCAEYEQFESGEHVLLTAGELHLERCLTDLRDRFARCDIQAGEPIVPYRETIVRAGEMKPAANKELSRGTVIATSTSKQISVRLSVQPLPTEITEFLTKNSCTIKKLYRDRQASRKITKFDENQSSQPDEEINNEILDDNKVLSLSKFKKKLYETIELVEEQRDLWASSVDQIVAFGPRLSGPNILIDTTTEAICSRFLQDPSVEDKKWVIGEILQAQDFSDKISYAFQLATTQGPLCNEPVQGIGIFLEQVTISSFTKDDTSRDNLGRLTGEIIKTMQTAIRNGFLDWSPRLCLAIYSCEIQASTEVLGRVYDVLTRRRGRVLSESLKDGTPFFTIQSILPVAESFGFSDEIRKRTSGAASPQLIFQGYEILDEDPYWVPFTEDDLEDLGELADKENVAKRYMDSVRKRKGLILSGEKLVKDAEKQKTLKR